MPPGRSARCETDPAAYWLIGREIVEVEQEGKKRAEYGERLVEELAKRLMHRFGKGFNTTGLKRMRQFYRAFPEGSTIPVELGGPEKGDHFYVDLVFYNRLLRCFVLVDLKLGKLTHQDLGQIQMYVNWYDRYQRVEHEAPTIGIVLCSEKNDAMVKITLPVHNAQILTARYQLYLPTEDELRKELAREREEAERMLRLAAQAERRD